MSKSALDTRLKRVRQAQRYLSCVPTEVKNRALATLADLLLAESSKIIKANARDLRALPGKTPPAFVDRLRLTPERILAMAESLRVVADLPDPVGEVVEERVLAAGPRARRVRAPLGVILMIFEARPNVAIEAFSIAFKSGNAIVLKGGRESRYSTQALYRCIDTALKASDVPSDAVWGLSTTDRSMVGALLKRKDLIDVVVPRGGDKLIAFVTENSSIPVIKNDRGLCHLYVHADADVQMALKIIHNAKSQRPSVCNSIETLLIHEAIAPAILPYLAARLSTPPVRFHACIEAFDVLERGGLGRDRLKLATKKSWDTEYLDYDLNVGLVFDMEEALAHIERHGSRHSEAIVCKSKDVAREFQARVDAAAVYWNASTRFTDGFALGLGGELGISTQKLHVRGPVGLRELTSARWVIDGSGEIRA